MPTDRLTDPGSDGHEIPRDERPGGKLAVTRVARIPPARLSLKPSVCLSDIFFAQNVEAFR